MGMYDYLGGEQTKAFGVAIVTIQPDRKNPENFSLDLSMSGGRLRGYKKGETVPYKTPYYNYGLDFMIFDYRTYNYDEPIDHNSLVVHVIEGGKYKETVRYDKINEHYKIGLVLNNYGEIVNIKTPKDFIEIVNHWRTSQCGYDKMQKKLYKEQGVTDLWALRDLNLPREELEENLRKIKEISDTAAKEFLTPFRERWFGNLEAIEKEINGGWPLGAVYDCFGENYLCEYDKYHIIRLLKEKYAAAGDDFNFELGEYFSWCLRNNVEVNKLKFLGWISKYSGEIPEKVIKEYNKSSTKKYRDHIYGPKKADGE